LAEIRDADICATVDLRPIATTANRMVAPRYRCGPRGQRVEMPPFPCGLNLNETSIMPV